VVTTKAYDTDAAARALATGEYDAVCSLQNGFTEERLVAALDPTVLAGTASYGARFIEPGRVTCTGVGEVVVGALSGATIPAKRVGSAFDEAEIETTVATDMPRRRYEKLAVNAGINGPSALARLSNGATLDGPGGEAAREAAREVARVARADGGHARRGRGGRRRRARRRRHRCQPVVDVRRRRRRPPDRGRRDLRRSDRSRRSVRGAGADVPGDRVADPGVGGRNRGSSGRRHYKGERGVRAGGKTVGAKLSVFYSGFNTTLRGRWRRSRRPRPHAFSRETSAITSSDRDDEESMDAMMSGESVASRTGSVGSAVRR